MQPSVHINALLYRDPAGGVEKAVGACVEGLISSASPGLLRIHAASPLPPLLPQFSPDLVSCACPSRGRRICLEQRAVLRAGRDVLWHHLGYVAPWISPSRFVVSIYDLTALLFPRFCSWENRAYFGLMLPHTIKAAARIFVPSLYVADQVRTIRPEAFGKTEVLALPLLPAVVGEPLERDVPPSELSQRTSLLYLGDSNPRKNLRFVLECYALLPDELRKRFPLLLCGKLRSPDLESLRRLSIRLGISDRVAVLPYQEDSALPGLIRSAALLLYPSLEEGYGFPPLEAMALGTPALVSDRGSLPEVAGARGAVVCPLDVRLFATSMRRILTQPTLHADLAARGQAGALRTTWRSYADHLLQTYETCRP